MTLSNIKKITDWILNNKITFLFFLCLIFLFSSNLTLIRGGVCSSSPCSDFNESFTDNHTVDYVLTSNIRTWLAPSGFFADVFFKKDNSLVLKSGYYNHTFNKIFTLDSKIDEYIEINTRKSNHQYTSRINTKPHNLFIFIIIIQLILLLSLPYWLIIGALILWLIEKDRLIGFIFGIVIISILVLFFLISILPVFFQITGDNYSTIEYITNFIF